MLEKIVLLFCTTALFTLMVVGATDIFLGHFFGYYLSLKVDLSQVLLAMSVFLAWIIVQKRDENIRVEILMNRAPNWMWVISSILTAICGTIMFGLITYGAYRMANTSYLGNEMSAATIGFPIWPAKMICAVAALMTFVVFILQPFTKSRTAKKAIESSK